ncbi:flagellar M-ring protein FliF [Aeromicrobium phragmitis]|uniref:Flagellar M-ring protein n=1 Tax=Aeromicrobium phragmitis TaxID=2478914 RepID=A0A3L8PM49_9ACTN|nr:flagellar basal-body MS-ring/collar protein FliF [Aeromicrobium phragmitis]RLV56466.1 flagellar M-ring protein FliF [Aeromicrobium phragmitis]
MKQQLQRQWTRTSEIVRAWTTGQKVAAAVGAAALLVGAVLVVRWIATPDYAPLYSELGSADAAQVIEQLDASGVPYRLTDAGGTILVPRNQVYETRIALSGQGLPSGDSAKGYSLLDEQDLSTSQFKEQTDFKRAMEGELARTIGAINGVENAVVHLAIPPKRVFAEEQDPTTASVLIKTRSGATLSGEQVQAVVNLVASSVDGLTPEQVTIADASGQVLSVAGSGAGGGGDRHQQVEQFQQQMSSKLQAMLDRVLGPGNSSVQVTADLDFDDTTTETIRYFDEPNIPPLSESSTTETYEGDPQAQGGATGVVGPDGQMDEAGQVPGEMSRYEKESTTADNAVGRSVETRTAAPGGVTSLHVGVVMDQRAPSAVGAEGRITDLVTAALGIDEARGDTVQVSAMPFDRTLEEQAASELEAAEAAERRAEILGWVRNGIIALAVALVAWLIWRRRRRMHEERIAATSVVVEQLRQDQLARESEVEQTVAMTALEQADRDREQQTRNEIVDLVEKQPDEVAALLRGWLVDR